MARTQSWTGIIVIVVVALTTANDERRASRATRETVLATYVAEAGVRKTLGSLPTAAINALNSGDSLDLGWGDVTSAGTVSGGTVTGTITQNAAPFTPYPVLTCPAGGYTPAALVPLTTGVTYNATTGVLKISGGNTLTLAVPPTTYYFSQVVTSGGSQIVFNNPSNLHVDIWIDDLLNVSGGGFVNTSGKSTMLGLWSCGSSSTSTWTLSGGSGAYFSVYTPNHAVSVTGSGDIWGSIIGKTVTATGGSKFHYDEALGRGPPSGLNPIAGSWAQLPGN